MSIMKNKTKSLKNKDKADKKDLNVSSVTKSIIVGILACWVGVYLSTFLWNEPSSGLSPGIIIGSEPIQHRNFNVSCSEDYKDHPVFEGCTPTRVCGRVIRDNIVTNDEVDRLMNIAKRGFQHGGSNGGASILDLHSGALSKGDKFVNIFQYLDKDQLLKTFKSDDFEFYSVIRSRVHLAIANEFGIDKSKLYLTHPTFFSFITNAPAKTTHDEYWHKHIDKIQYGSFDYTSLLYLTDHGKDFTGGRFVFDDEYNMIVEPKRGRLSFFTSGSENPHHVEKIHSGTRYAMTISFTCDRKKGIKDPSLR